ncbi:MAG: S8 family peptidase [Casimicrobiaceae bacterium]|nr:S8 family peptidase [Casimicrobiaceae bacterium]
MPVHSARQLARRIAAQPGIEYAEPNERDFALLTPNDPRFLPDQWPLKAVTLSPATTNYGINAPAAWAITTGNPTIRVAVLDTGIIAHADLSGNVVGGYDFVSDVVSANDGNGRDPDPSDPGDWVTAAEASTPGGPFAGCDVSPSSWHGSHVAGIISAVSNNSLGIAGVSWTSKIVPVRVLGKCGGTIADIADGIVWAAGGIVSGVPNNPNPARILNLSLGGLGPCPSIYRSAIATARSLGALVVVAAGNDNLGTGSVRPANCPGVMAVTSTAQDGSRAVYSNFGRPAVISAPGGDQPYDVGVLSTVNSGTTTPVPTPAGDAYAFYHGTSMAAPHVAGTAALMLAIRPSLEAHHLAAFIRGTATPYVSYAAPWDCNLHHCGDGIVNAAAAVAAAQACTTPPSGVPAAVDVACNGDYDGNGIVSPATDGLIALRLALGMTGNAVTQGALGTCATRTTFDTIRRWSNANCGTTY